MAEERNESYSSVLIRRLSRSAGVHSAAAEGDGAVRGEKCILHMYMLSFPTCAKFKRIKTSKHFGCSLLSLHLSKNHTRALLQTGKLVQ